MNKTNTSDLSIDDKLKTLFTKPLNLLLFATLCTALWGSAFPAIKYGYKVFDLADDDISSKILFAGIRFFVAGIMTYVIYFIFFAKLFKNDTLKNFTKYNKLKKALVVDGVSFFLTLFQYNCFYIGLSNTTGVKGSILNSISSFFTIILASICFKNDRLNIKKIIGLVCGIGGILIVNLNSLHTFDTNFKFEGEGLMILASLSFAIGSIISKKYANYINPIVLTSMQLSLGGFFLMLGGLLNNGKLNIITPLGITILAYLAFLSCIAFSLWTLLLKYNDASKVSIYNFLTPIFGALLSSLFLGEALSFNSFAALVLVCYGIFKINK